MYNDLLNSKKVNVIPTELAWGCIYINLSTRISGSQLLL